MDNKKLAIFGPYPPPVGGISMHIQRMEHFLLKENISYVIYNHDCSTGKYVVPTNKRIFWYVKFLFNYKHKLVHFHQFFDFHYLYYFVFSLINKTPTIVTIHSERLLLYNSIKRKFLFWLLRHTWRNVLISVSEELNTFLNEKGIKSQYIPAYIPPTKNNSVQLEEIDKIRFLFSVWKVNKELSEKIYNIPIAFEFLKRHKDKYHMTFMIGDKETTDEKYLLNLINKYGIKENIDILFNEPLVDYLPNFKFLLRTNLHDGFPLSLREALDLNIPVVASDIGTRPKGSVLFKSNDIDDLSKKIKYVSSADANVILQEKEQKNYHNRLIEIYKEILK